MAVRAYLRCLDTGCCRARCSPGGSCLNVATLPTNQAMVACAFWGIQINCPVWPLFPGQIGWIQLWLYPISIAVFKKGCLISSTVLPALQDSFSWGSPNVPRKTRYQTCLSQKVTNLQQNMQRNKVKWGEQGIHRKKSTQMGYLLSFAKKRMLSFGMQCENAPYYSRQHS